MVKMNNMKGKLIAGMLAVIMLVVFACGGQNDSSNHGGAVQENEGQYTDKEPVMHFDTLVHDFGTIIEGERVVCYFDYANTGGDDLVITGVETSCGCTIPNWNREPLKPGAKETLELIFDATGRSGEQRKLVTVKSNASNQVVLLTIRAKVINRVS